MTDLFSFAYPDPPAQQHSATSVAASKRVITKAAKDRQRVYECLKEAGAVGMTDEQMQDALNMVGNSQRPRRIELVRSLHVRDSGRTMDTRSGSPATVWVAVNTGG